MNIFNISINFTDFKRNLQIKRKVLANKRRNSNKTLNQVTTTFNFRVSPDNKKHIGKFAEKLSQISQTPSSSYSAYFIYALKFKYSRNTVLSTKILHSFI